MANRNSGYNSRRSNASRSRTPRTFGRPRWPFIVVLILAVTLVVAISAYRRSHNHSAATKEVAVGANHYPDLEMTEGAKSRNIIKNYVGFTVCFSPANHTPDWVGWELLRSETDGAESRSNKFWQDTQLDGCPSPNDYRNSGYDKGHMCPAADQKWSTDAMTDCFVMANMTPQVHALNAGAWKTLEEKERLWAQRDSALVIVAGPIYKPDDKKTIGDGVRVPSAFFKVLLAPYVAEPRAIGFIYPNMKAPGNMQDYSMSVDKVEEITGLDFFSNLPDELEEKVEATADFRTWNAR